MYTHTLSRKAGNTSVWGSGFTSEGIDQNPALYDFLLGQSWRERPVADIADFLVARAHRRYGLAAADPHVTKAWSLLQASMFLTLFRSSFVQSRRDCARGRQRTAATGRLFMRHPLQAAAHSLVGPGSAQPYQNLTLL